MKNRIRQVWPAFLLLGTLQAGGQELPKIHEKVEVRQIEVPVRVYRKGMPVDGLQASDFRLIIDGSEVQVSGLSVSRKRLKAGSAESAFLPGRLFVLVFNVADYQLELQRAIDLLFAEVLRRGDSIMFLSNNFFSGERLIGDVAAEKRFVEDLLRLEQKWMKRRVLALENRLYHELNELRARQADGDMSFFVQTLMPRFVETYRRYADEHLAGMVSLDADGVQRLSGHLQGRHLDKWVVAFYQRGFFPVIRQGGGLHRILLEAQRNARSDDPEMESMLLHDLLLELETGLLGKTGSDAADLAKPLAASGATCHTVLLRPLRPDRRLEDFEWQIVPTAAEDTLRRAARLTGGVLLDDNRLPLFFAAMNESEDILYHLTYAPPAGASQPPKSLSVQVRREDCRVLYDDRKRAEYLRELEAWLRQKAMRLQLGQVAMEQGPLVLSVSGWPEGEARPRRIDIRLRIVDEAALVVFDRHREFPFNAPGERILVNLPRLKKGEYDIIVEAMDPQNGQTDMAICTVNRR